MMLTFQELGTSIDAESHAVRAALDCSEKVPPEGFIFNLSFVMPNPEEPGGDSGFTPHPGMQMLMEAMVAIVRSEPFDFADLIAAARRNLAANLAVRADAFAGHLNAIREAAGLPALISAEMNGAPAVPLADVEARVQAGIAEAMAAYREGEDARIADRVRIAIEAQAAERAAGEDLKGMPPTPPRGAPKRGAA